MEADKVRGRIAVEQPGELLVGELFHHWRQHGWDDPDVGLSEKSQTLYTDWWNRYCAMDRAFVGLPLSQAGSREINQFRRRVQQKVKANYQAETVARARRGKGPRKGRDPEGRPTTNKIMVMISAMFTHGRREGMLRLTSDPTVERAHPMRDGAVPRAAVETIPVEPLGFCETELIRAALLLDAEEAWNRAAQAGGERRSRVDHGLGRHAAARGVHGDPRRRLPGCAAVVGARVEKTASTACIPHQGAARTLDAAAARRPRHGRGRARARWSPRTAAVAST